MADTENPPSDASADESSDDHNEALETFKADPEAADNEIMDDGIHARPRMNWNPVTDVGGGGAAPPDAPPEKSSFQFDLGGALARLGDPDDAAIPEPALSEPALSEPALSEPNGFVDTVEPEVAPAPATPAPATPAPAAPVPAAPVPPADDPLSSVRGLLDGDVDEVSHVAESPLETRTAPPFTQRLQTQAPGSVFADETPQPTEARVAPADPAPPAQPAPQPVVALPEQARVAPVEPAPPARPAPQPQVVAPVEQAPAAPQTPVPQTAAAPPAAPQTPAMPTAHVPNAAGDASTAPALPSTPVIPGETDDLPTLPVAPAMASPMVTAPLDSAPSTPDVIALRSAQLRANKQQRQSKMFGRTVLAFMLIAGLLAAALIFGRAYLFPTEWDSALTPVVDEIQEARGADFDHTVPLVVQPADQYVNTVLDASIGSGWAGSLPEWRAAGLAAGSATIESITASIATQIPVVYDASSDRIYQVADADEAVVANDLRIVLNEVYDAQLGAASSAEAAGVGFTGVSSPSFLAERAVDAYLVRRDESAGVASADVDVDVASDLPLPIAYELAAIDHLGEAILVGANIDPASVSLGQAYPEVIAASLDDAPTRTASGLIRPGEQSLADPVALGVDDWSLVWGARLPAVTVDRMVELVIGDSYRPIDRSGTTCFVGVFQTATDSDGSLLFSSMLRWAGDAPVGAQALATQLGTRRIQIESCDPGSGDGAPDPAAVDALINRQIARLARVTRSDVAFSRGSC